MPQTASTPTAGKTIVTAWLVAGTLDILCAFAQVYFMRHVNPVPVVLKYIASGVFGPDAMKGGEGMMVMGLLFHYIIALGCVLVFYFLYPRLGMMRINKCVTAVVYALAVWAVTNLVIVPLSLAPHGPVRFPNAFISIGILVVAIGVPVSFIVGRRVISN